MRDTLFFDMDGTLIDSEPGIVAGIEHTFSQLGRPVPSQLRQWIGPPLRDSFQSQLDDPALVTQALELYRQRYDARGWSEHTIYAGIGDTVESLHAAGHRVAVVTSKNERFARRIAEHLPFGHCFEDIVGASDDGERRFKPDLIAEAMHRLSVAPEQCWMIGDRRMDIEGARHHGMRNVGVLWGFGDEAELRTAGAIRLAQHPQELPALLAA